LPGSHFRWRRTRGTNRVSNAKTHQKITEDKVRSLWENQQNLHLNLEIDLKLNRCALFLEQKVYLSFSLPHRLMRRNNRDTYNRFLRLIFKKLTHTLPTGNNIIACWLNHRATELGNIHIWLTDLCRISTAIESSK
jgi:hypothetical protein